MPRPLTGLSLTDTAAPPACGRAASSQACQPPGGTGVARCAAGQRPALPLSTGCVCWAAPGSCGIAAPGPWSPGRARRLRGWGGGGGGRRRWDRRPWARQPALGAQIGEGAPLGPRGAALRQRVAVRVRVRVRVRVQVGAEEARDRLGAHELAHVEAHLLGLALGLVRVVLP